MERGKGGAVGWIAKEIDSLHGLVALETIQWKVVQRPSDGKMVEETERSCCLHLHSLIWQIGKIEFLEGEEIGQLNDLISHLVCLSGLPDGQTQSWCSADVMGE